MNPSDRLRGIAANLEAIYGRMVKNRDFPGNADAIEAGMKGWKDLVLWCERNRTAGYAAAVRKQFEHVWKLAADYEVACREKAPVRLLDVDPNGKPCTVDPNKAERWNAQKILAGALPLLVNYARDVAAELRAVDDQPNERHTSATMRQPDSAPPAGNLFDSIEPHRHLPEETRTALWEACNYVRKYDAEFAQTVAWLDADYSEAAVYERHLRESARPYKNALWSMVFEADRCATFPRRIAMLASRSDLPAPRRLALLQRFYSVRGLEHIQPAFIIDLSEHPEKVRDWVVQLTIQTARSGGLRIEDGKVVHRSYSEVGDKGLPDAITVEIYWRWLDEQTRQTLQCLKAERRERDARARRDAKDRMGRFREAVRDAVKADIDLVNRVECSRRLVLLAAMIAAPEPLSLSAEFSDMPWETQGNRLGIGGPCVPGRETFFEKYDFMKGATQWSIAGVMADGFGNLVARALNVLNTSIKRATLHIPESKPVEAYADTSWQIGGVIQDLPRQNDDVLDRVSEAIDKAAPVIAAPLQPLALPAGDSADDGGPVEDPHDTRKAVWAGKRIYLGNDTEVSRLFWLLAKPVGRAASLAEVQRAIDGMETHRDGRPDDVRKASQRVRKVVSKLRAAIREAGLDDHILVAKGGSQAEPEYTMLWRFAP